MRKSTLFLACCIGLMLLASCKKDPVAPTISILQAEGYLTENAQVYANEDVMVGFVATGEKLVKLETKITKDGAVVSNNIESIDEQPSYTSSFPITLNVTGTMTITGTVTDAAGQTASVSINVICNEKPNAKFVGHYEGNALGTGSYQAEITGMDPLQEEFTDREVPVILDIEAGDNMNEVVATCIIDDRTMTTTGHVEGDKVTFEAINDVVTFAYDLGFMTIYPEVNLTYMIVGTLVEGELNLDGTCTGNGEINAFFYNGTLTIDAIVGGSLNKMR